MIKNFNKGSSNPQGPLAITPVHEQGNLSKKIALVTTCLNSLKKHPVFYITVAQSVLLLLLAALKFQEQLIVRSTQAECEKFFFLKNVCLKRLDFSLDFSSTFDLKVERLLSVIEHRWPNGSIFRSIFSRLFKYSYFRNACQRKIFTLTNI